MNFNEYQKLSRETAVYPDVGKNFIYPTLGLASEVGEISNKIKKALRDDGGLMTDQRKEVIKRELGDVLWYISQLSSELDLSLDEVAKLNIEKLKSRKERGVLGGDGDNR